jgi:hypothetical protein
MGCGAPQPYQKLDGHHLALRAVKPFAQPDVIHVNMVGRSLLRRPLIMGCAATQPYREKVLADDLGERQRAIQRPARRCENQFLLPPKD